MTQPVIHSCTWFDRDSIANGQPTPESLSHQPPQALVGETLYVWVTYPTREKKKRKRTAASKRKPIRIKPQLWGVVIFEALECIDDFSFEVTLKKVLKREEAVIKFWVKNDPRDQSDEAQVFGLISPSCKLCVLDEKLVHMAGKRVFDAIGEMWSVSTQTK